MLRFCCIFVNQFLPLRRGGEVNSPHPTLLWLTELHITRTNYIFGHCYYCSLTSTKWSHLVIAYFYLLKKNPRDFRKGLGLFFLTGFVDPSNTNFLCFPRVHHCHWLATGIKIRYLYLKKFYISNFGVS